MNKKHGLWTTIFIAIVAILMAINIVMNLMQCCGD